VTSATREKKRRGGWFKEEFGTPERRLAYYMVLPAVLIIFVIAFFPILYSVLLSVTDSTITGLGSFAGTENYVELFQNPDFWEGLKNTVIFTVASVALEFIIGLAVALAVNRAFRGRGLVRAAVLVPWAFPTVISAAMWRLMFQDPIGIINETANYLGIISQPRHSF
jgi:ABC-type sugar transport system permease subunit